MKKYFIIVCISLLGLGVLTLLEYQKTKDGKLHLIFCNVGQGDGILIKSPSGKLLMVDAGPDESILSCLSDNIPFWHRMLDIFILTHPHSDHFAGVFEVFPRMTVKSYVSETLANRSLSYEELLNSVKKEGLQTRFVKRGTEIALGDGVKLTVLAPTDEYLRQHSPNGFISDSEENASLVMLLTYGTFSAILSGDSEVSGMYVANPGDIDVLHVPHHGSKYGLDKQIVHQMDPEVAVVSVGKNNYGHPTKETLQILRDYGTRIFRTDQDGEVKIVSDGKTYLVDKKIK